MLDVDLEKCFDRVGCDVLMSRLERRVRDKRLLRVIRRCLKAGMMAEGVVVERYEGAAKHVDSGRSARRTSTRSRLIPLVRCPVWTRSRAGCRPGAPAAVSYVPVQKGTPPEQMLRRGGCCEAAGASPRTLPGYYSEPALRKSSLCGSPEPSSPKVLASSATLISPARVLLNAL